jgi:hypothetical protein
MSNVINFSNKKSLQKQPQLLEREATAPAEQGQVVDLNEKRSQVLKTDRRKAERVMLSEFISMQVVVPGFGLLKISLYDIHENGLSFDIDDNHGKFQVGEEVAMRVYLNRESYFPLVVKVRHATFIPDENVNRHGSEFVKDSINDVALHHFVKFLENVSRVLRNDKGDLTLNKINS